MKKIIKAAAIVIITLLILAAGLIGWLTVTEYRPDDAEQVSVVSSSEGAALTDGTLRIVSWNIGYCGLGEGASFVLDGGDDNGTPESEEVMLSYYAGVRDTLLSLDADIYLLQEVDSDSSRSYRHDEVSMLQSDLGTSQSAYALNYSCPFVPFPWPPIGKVISGILTLTDYNIISAERISLPCPFDWPLRVANLKRCLLVSRIPVGDRELVIVNLHLEAYDDGEGKAAQTAMLLDILEKEYAAGNYVIAGGDFNQTFPGSLDVWRIINDELWTPGVLESSSLPDDWRYVYDSATPTCRLLNHPYDPADSTTQYYVIDGFIVSPNIEVVSIESIDSAFAYSDHNPVSLTITLREPLDK